MVSLVVFLFKFLSCLIVFLFVIVLFFISVFIFVIVFWFGSIIVFRFLSNIFSIISMCMLFSLLVDVVIILVILL